MAADYTKILDKLVRLNRGMNLKLREGTTTLDVNIYKPNAFNFRLRMW